MLQREMVRNMKPDEPIVLTTDRLVLRPTCEADLEDFIRVGSHLAVARNTGTFPHPFTREFAVERLAKQMKSLEEGTGVCFAIRLKATGEGIGSTGFFGLNREHGTAEVGYVIDPAHAGRGYATESLGAVVRHAFEDWGVRKLCACYFLDNPASGRVLEKAGFVREGVRRKQFVRLGELRDDVMVGLLREEYQK